MQVETYHQPTRGELGLTEAEWQELADYVDDLAEGIKKADDELEGVAGIEEDPPSIDENTFKPRGWIGQYPAGIRVVANRFSEFEEEQLLEDVAGWADLIGATTFEAAFPVSNNLLIDRRSQLSGYSNALIDLTELLRSGRLSTEVNRTENRGQQPAGRPLLEATMQAEIQGSQDVVTEQLEFSFDTPANRLLVQFHANLSSRLQTLADEYSLYADAFDRQIRYHEAFLSEGVAQRLLDAAMTADFTAANTLSQIRNSASGAMLEIVDLWEAFQRGRRLELRVQGNLNTAVKPLSKIYELWCLGTLLELLADICGTAIESPDLVGEYQISPRVTLLYNSNVRRYSSYLSPAFDVSAGKPDFVLVVDGDVVWVGDAKSKSWRSLQVADYQRFLTYIMDLLPADHTGTILYAEKKRPTQRRNFHDFEVQHLPLRPGRQERGRNELRDLFMPLVEDGSGSAGE